MPQLTTAYDNKTTQEGPTASTCATTRAPIAELRSRNYLSATTRGNWWHQP